MRCEAFSGPEAGDGGVGGSRCRGGWGISSPAPRTVTCRANARPLAVRPCSALEKGPSFSKCRGRDPPPTSTTPRRSRTPWAKESGSVSPRSCQRRRVEEINQTYRAVTSLGVSAIQPFGGGWWALCRSGSLKKRDLFSAALQGCTVLGRVTRPSPCAVPERHRAHHPPPATDASAPLARDSYNRTVYA